MDLTLLVTAGLAGLIKQLCKSIPLICVCLCGVLFILTAVITKPTDCVLREMGVDMHDTGAQHSISTSTYSRQL